jgi:low temperature requirement protein LtrA
MALFAARYNHLRVRGGPARVTFVELFFDLVFVFAVTQLSHGLLEHLTPLGVLQTAILMLAIWWAWIDNAWVTNWIDPDKAPVRLLLFVLMFGGLVVSVSIPEAFAGQGVVFGLAYAAFAVTPKFFMLWATRNHDPAYYRNFQRIAIWRCAGAALWVAGGFADPSTRLAIWALALAVDTVSPLVGFYVPGLGRSTTADWNVEGHHLAERCGLFIIIALGESVLITGQTVARLPWTAVNIAAFVNAFAGSVMMWAVYFNIGAERSTHHFVASDDPGRIARTGYTYMHIPIVAGIIVSAVADELVLHHPGGHTDVKTALAILGGPALYLVGNALFKRLTAPVLPLSHLVGLGLLALFSFAVPYVPPLALSAAATAVLLLVAVWEWLSIGRNAATPAGH